ncbi:MAG: GNAT family N-acetyltransferase [Chloroflexi bacterium]|nr:GNAT family N-acetyltransferase [Chloroflexota bacterium]
MSTPTPFQIRDGLESDLPDALALDHSFETDTVWQMTIRQEEGWHISFRRERLPRVIEVVHEADEKRLRSMLPGNQCFLVATRRDDSSVIGYLAMRRDYLNQIGLITDIVVTRSHRRMGVGARLVAIAGVWAKEHDLTRLIIETQTKNYPAIQFCQHSGFAFCGYNDQQFRNRDIAVYFSQSLR